MISGKKVVLRALEREDLMLMHKWMNDEEIMTWARSKPDNLASMESVEKEFEQDVKGENLHRRTFIVVESRSGKPVGWGMLRWWRPFSTTADLGLVIADRDLRGQGFGTEATKLLVDVAFNQHNMHKAEMFTRADNKAAITAVKKCGFKLEGTHRDEVYFNGKYYDGLSFGLIRSGRARVKK